MPVETTFGDVITISTGGVLKIGDSGTIEAGGVTPLSTGGMIEEVGTAAILTSYASPAKIVGGYIVNSLEFMTDPSEGDEWPLFLNHLPDAQDSFSNSGAIYDTAGTLDGRLMTGAVCRHPGLQIKMRSRTYDAGYSRLLNIANWLAILQNATIEVSGTSYIVWAVRRMTDVVSLGMESGTSRRFLFTANFIATIT